MSCVNFLKLLFIIGILGISLSGCSSFWLGNGQSVVLEAEERAITNVKVKETSRPGRPDPERLVCAEPSPDVSKVVSDSLAFATTIAEQGEVSLSRDSVEGVVQLAERTTTIQLLRDQMHRACEAYSNGAISGTTYTMIMSKNNDAMVTLMLGENAAGAFGRSGASVAGKAASEATANFQGTAMTFEKAMQQQTQAEAELIAAQETLELAKTNAAAAAEVAAADDATKVDKEKEKAAKETLDAAQAKYNAAKALRDEAVKNALTSANMALKASAEITDAEGHGGLDHKPDAAIANTLADIQRGYLNRSTTSDFVATCLVEMGQNFVPYTVDENGNELFPGGISAEAYFFELYLHGAIQEKEGPYATHISQEHEKLNRVGTGDTNFERYQSILNAERQTWLSEFCWNNLSEIIALEQQNHFALDQQELTLRNNQLIVRASEALSQQTSATQKALESCGKLEGAERKVCLNTVATSVGSKTLAPLPSIAADGFEIDKLFLPQPVLKKLDDYAKQLSTLLEETEGITLRAPKDSVDENDAVKKQLLETAKKEHEKLNAAAKKLTRNNESYTNAASFIVNTKGLDSNNKPNDGPQDLVDQVNSLVSELVIQLNLPDKDQAKITSIKYQIMSNQALAKAMVEQIEEQQTNLESLEQQATDFKKDAASYHKAYNDVLKN